MLTENVPADCWELDGFDMKFVGDIRIVATFIRSVGFISVDARVGLERDITCSRCLASSCQAVTIDFRKNYPLSELHDYLEIDQDIREEVLLNFPMRVLCKPDCKGLCPACAVNLNVETCRCASKKAS